MKRSGSVMKSRTVMRLLAITAIICTSLPSGAVWAAGNPAPLSTVPIPTPPNLGDFVKDRNAAIKLGKALFWDMQTGGDGGQACASCHYRAGADPFDVRATNQLNPRVTGSFTGTSVLSGPNQTLLAGMFPFTQVQDP